MSQSPPLGQEDHDNDTRKSRWDRPGLAMGLGLLVAGVFLINEARTLWFWGDDWAFLLGRSLRGETGKGLFEPHNEHWSTVPVLIYRAMYHLVGLDRYLAFAILPILAHLALCGLLYLLLRRCGSDGWPATCAVLVLAFAGLGENTLWSFQIGFLSSLVLGVLALLSVQLFDRPLVAIGLASVALTLAVMSSGMGTLMVLWAALFTLLRRGLLWTIAVGALPTLVYAGWYLAVGREATAAAVRPPVLSVIQFGWSGVDTVWENITGNSDVGSLIAIALGVVAVFVRAAPALHALALSGMAGLLPAFMLIGFSRAVAGVEAAGANRYAHLGLILCVPALAVAFRAIADNLPRPGLGRVVVVGVVLGFVFVQGIATTDYIQEGRRGQTDALQARLAAALSLADAGEPLLRPQPDPLHNPDITMAGLQRPEVERVVSDRSFDELALLNARVNLQVAASPTELNLPGVEELRAQGVVGEVDRDDCESTVDGLATGRIDLKMGPAGGQAYLVTDAAQVQVQLLDAGLVSETAILPATPGVPLYLASTAPSMVLRVLVPDQRLNICAPPGR